MVSMKYQHVITNCDSEPFKNKQVKKLLDRYVRRTVERTGGCWQGCDPFARRSITTSAWAEWFVTNDLNEEMPTDHHMEANDFGEYVRDCGIIMDLVLFDPPYTLRQLKDHYEAVGMNLPQWQTQNQWRRCKDALAPLVPPGGYAITFGYSTRGFGAYRGFKKREILILQSGGIPDRYDVLVTVEEKVQTALF